MAQCKVEIKTRPNISVDMEGVTPDERSHSEAQKFVYLRDDVTLKVVDVES